MQFQQFVSKIMQSLRCKILLPLCKLYCSLLILFFIFSETNMRRILGDVVGLLFEEIMTKSINEIREWLQVEASQIKKQTKRLFLCFFILTCVVFPLYIISVPHNSRTVTTIS